MTKFRSLVPASQTWIVCLVLAGGLALSMVLASLFEHAALARHVNAFSAAALIMLGLLLVLDLYGAMQTRIFDVERQVNGSVAVNRWFAVTFRMRHSYVRPKKIELFESLNADLDCDSMPLRFVLFPGEAAIIEFRMRARQRGLVVLPGVYLRVRSPLGFWCRQYFVECPSQIRVYPDFSAISAYTLLATDNHVSQLGIKRRPRRGEGLDFLQLRDYRDGDSLRQIDWKATARRHRLISREYQDERDQQVVLMIDSGRRMRAQDDELNHFDHTLNAALLVSYIALRQGDSVGIFSFGKEYRWLAPQKSAGGMKTLLNGLYDLHTSTTAPDYLMAAQKVAALQRKRALVIIMTNTRDEDADEILMATRLLRKKHLVVLANIREMVLEKMQEEPVINLESALAYASAKLHMSARHDNQLLFNDQGILALDCLAKELPTRVTNSYLEIKRAGML